MVRQWLREFILSSLKVDAKLPIRYLNVDKRSSQLQLYRFGYSNWPQLDFEPLLVFLHDTDLGIDGILSAESVEDFYKLTQRAITQYEGAFIQVKSAVVEIVASLQTNYSIRLRVLQWEIASPQLHAQYNEHCMGIPYIQSVLYRMKQIDEGAGEQTTQPLISNNNTPVTSIKGSHGKRRALDFWDHVDVNDRNESSVDESGPETPSHEKPVSNERIASNPEPKSGILPSPRTPNSEVAPVVDIKAPMTPTFEMRHQSSGYPVSPSPVKPTAPLPATTLPQNSSPVITISENNKDEDKVSVVAPVVEPLADHSNNVAMDDAIEDYANDQIVKSALPPGEETPDSVVKRVERLEKNSNPLLPDVRIVRGQTRNPLQTRTYNLRFKKSELYGEQGGKVYLEEANQIINKFIDTVYEMNFASTKRKRQSAGSLAPEKRQKTAATANHSNAHLSTESEMQNKNLQEHTQPIKLEISISTIIDYPPKSNVKSDALKLYTEKQSPKPTPLLHQLSEPLVKIDLLRWINRR